MRKFTSAKGAEFTYQGLEPYTRKDGTQMHLEIWHGRCGRPDCIEPVRIAIPQGYDPAASSAFGAVHCKHHKLSPSEVSARRVAAAAAARTRIGPEMLTELIEHRKKGLSCSALALLYPATENHIRKITAPFLK